jgi:FKBP-type peptidyl-prolyl cis-trans isomerase (trigger factor)
VNRLTPACSRRWAEFHLSRQKLKRQLLDKLDEMHKFAPPPTLVEDEFNSVWNTTNRAQ